MNPSPADSQELYSTISTRTNSRKWGSARASGRVPKRVKVLNGEEPALSSHSPQKKSHFPKGTETVGGQVQHMN